jgi:hypothetical protein
VAPDQTWAVHILERLMLTTLPSASHVEPAMVLESTVQLIIACADSLHNSP